MNDQVRTNSELLEENAFLKQKIQELQHSESVHKRTEEALRDSEQGLHNLADNLHNVVVYQLTAEPDGGRRFTYISRAVERLNEITKGEVLADAGVLYGQVLPEYRALVKEREEEALKNLTTMRVKVQSRLPSGRLRWFEYASTPRHQADGLLVWDGIEIDVTEQKRVEEALQESEKKLRQITENMLDCVALVDESGTYQYVTPSYREALGYAPENMVGMTGFSITHPDDLERLLKLCMDGIEQGLSEIRYQTRLRHMNGHYVPMEVRTRSLKDTQGKFVGGVVASRDITERLQIDEERKRAEDEFRKSEEKYRTIIENMEDGFHEVDLKGNYTLFNESTRKMMGYEREDLLGMNYRQYADEENASKVYKIYNQVYRTGEPVKNFEWQIIRKDGDRRDIEVSISLIRNTEGHPTGFRGIARDTTDRKLAEKALRESEARWKFALEGARDGVWDWDAVTNHVYFSDQWKAMLGYASHEVGNTLDEWDRRVHPDDKTTVYADLERHFRRETEFYQNEHRLLCKDGSYKWILDRGKVIEWTEDGKPRRVIGTHTDITDRKRSEEEKVKVEEQYRQAQKMEAIGQLAGGIAHDFNNMLSIILGYSQMVLMKLEPSSPLRANIREIVSAGRRSADLVRQLLAFARKQIIAPKTLDLNDAVAGMLNMLRKLIGEDIDLLWMPAADLWPVKMDPAQVDQILANLAVNARDSISGVGKITIETGKVEFDEAYCAQHAGFVPGHYAMLAVSDNGCGMDKETCEQIFEPFFTTKEVGKGTGMGLATVYGIVKQNNGFIKVYSEPGKGATFKIYLPRLKDERMAIDEPSTHVEPTTGKETVLLVEDNEALLKMGKMMLEELGYTVVAAGSPNEAFQLAEQYAGDIHLVLTDVVMPEMSGRDLQRRLSALWPSLKFLFMSGYTANVIANRGVLDEGVHFLQKPFLMEVLAAKVKEALFATSNPPFNSDLKIENNGR